MAMTPEKKVKQTIAKVLKEMGAYYFFPATGGYGRSGVPDIVGCYEGKFLASSARRVRTPLLHYRNLNWRR